MNALDQLKADHAALVKAWHADTENMKLVFAAKRIEDLINQMEGK